MIPSVVITTRNRREELRVALGSVFTQTVPLEVIVMDDGSTDGTAEMVREEFPAVRLHRREDSKGLVVRRNEAARIATGEIIFSIDDDAAFSTATVVEKTIRDFEDSRIGAIAIPYTEPHKSNQVMQRAPDLERVWITDCFIGTAHALRCDIFLKLGGYREDLIHQGEESDYCIRLLQAGFCVRLGNADPVCHFESPRRDFRRMDFFGGRNNILFAWYNVPWPHLPLHLAATTINGLRTGLRNRRLLRKVQGIAAGYRDCLGAFQQRSPVSVPVYRLSRRLKKRGPATLQSAEALRGSPLRPPSQSVELFRLG